MSETFDIDLTGVDTSSTGEGGWSAFPSGEYRVMITKAEVKDTRSGTGKRLALELTILSNDELNGRSHWEGINIINPSEVAQRIAHEHLAMLADASGLPRDFLKTAGVGALQGKVVLAQIAKVKAKDAQIEYADKDGFENTVRAYGAPDGKAKTEQPTSSPDTSAETEAEIPF
jgi:hypothetical protein